MHPDARAAAAGTAGDRGADSGACPLTSTALPFRSSSMLSPLGVAGAFPPSYRIEAATREFVGAPAVLLRKTWHQP